MKPEAVAVQGEVLSQQSTSAGSNSQGCGSLLAVGVILKWLCAKCSGIDGFKFRPPWPSNDKVRGRRGVRKPLFLEIPIIWLFKSTWAHVPPPAPSPNSSNAERSAHHHPINHMCAGRDDSWAWRREWKGVWDLEHTLSIIRRYMETRFWIIACRRRVRGCCRNVLRTGQRK